MQNHALKPALQAFFHDSGFARYSIPVLLSPRQREKSLVTVSRIFYAEKHIDIGVRVSLENFATLPDVRIIPLYAIHRIVDGSLNLEV
jgi:hypothetical protein